MADKHQREIVLNDKILLTMVQKKGELVEKGRAIAGAMEELAMQHEKLTTEHNEQMNAVNNLKLDIIRRTQKVAHGLLGEFELPVTTEIRDGKVVLLDVLVHPSHLQHATDHGSEARRVTYKHS